MSSAAKIAQLSELMRRSGDKLLNGDQYKLTLSPQLLRDLCEALSPIVKFADKPLEARPFIRDSNQFRVVSNDANCSQLPQHDLRLIFDFVQKTRVLCVTQFTTSRTAETKDDDADDAVDTSTSVSIDHFRNLRRLEISKLSVARVHGIQKLRAHLYELSAKMSVRSVAEIIAHCGGDRCDEITWNRLHTLDLSYNGLRTLDNSLDLIIGLQHLNLSHNQLVDSVGDAIRFLPHLQHLDLGYNRLTQVPRLHADVIDCLQVLKLSGNQIENLRQLPRMKALRVLDLSDNCVIEETELLPLRQLAALQSLSLAGNPLACGPRYRSVTAKYLHRGKRAATAVPEFLLDNKPLSRYERSLIGEHYSMPISAAPSVWSLGCASKNIFSSARNTSQSLPNSIGGSMQSLSTIGSMSGSIQIKKRRLRKAAIADYPPGCEPITEDVVTTDQKARSTLHLAVCTKDDQQPAHVATKKRIEEMRRQRGDHWLQRHDDDNDGDNELAGDVLPEIDGFPWELAPVSPEWMTKYPLLSQPSQTTDDVIQANTTNRPSSGHNRNAETINNPVVNTNLAAASDNFIVDDEEEGGDQNPPSDVEPDANQYSVILQPCNTRKMLLVVSDKFIRERDAISGRTVTKWCISMLDSCDRLRSNVLQLHFDTLNRSRRERIYLLETERMGQKVEKFLREILEQRSLSVMNQTLYRCVKCDVTFAHESSRQRLPSAVRCTKCASPFLVEINENYRRRPSRPLVEPPVHPIDKKECPALDASEPFKFSYDNLAMVDHRLKLHLYQHVFENDEEQLKWLIRGHILLDGPDVAIYGPALFVFTTEQFYVLRIIGLEGDGVSKWLKPHLAGSKDNLLAIQVLPWKIGVGINIKDVGNVKILLQDVQRTENLLLYLAKHPLPTCFVKFQPNNLAINQNLLRITGDEPLKTLTILSTFKSSSNIIAGASSPPHKMLGLILTETHLYLLKSDHRWLNAVSPSELFVLQKKSMANLITAERLNDHAMRLTFVDSHEEWTCTFDTSDNASRTLGLMRTDVRNTNNHPSDLHCK